MIAVGLMSGTSLDGIDAAAIEIGDGERPAVTIVRTRHTPYAAALRARALAAASGEALTASDVATLHADLGDAYADAAEEIVRLLPARPAFIALHGQTIAHLPDRGATLQLGDASRVARRCGVPAISDFRSADVSAGGQGAPLVPFADHLLFRERAPIALLNLGGIANLTLIPSDRADDVVAFDTGPANIVIDALCATVGEPFDRDGTRARAGRTDETALARALAHPFFAKRAPKSTGRQDFGHELALRLLRECPGLDDAIATATALSARTIAQALARETPAGTRWRELAIAGGGSANPALVDALRADVAPLIVRPLDELGIPASAREAVSFAILGAYRWRGLPNTSPAAPVPTMRRAAGPSTSPEAHLREAHHRRVTTEGRNPRAKGLGDMSTRQILELMNREDTTVPLAVARALPAIERAVERIVRSIQMNGHVIYVGAGTSGRLGALDASEIPPTFGAGRELFQAVIAGGDLALRDAVEGAEDDEGSGGEALAAASPSDVVVGISASGGARFVVGAIARARNRGAGTVAVTCVGSSALARAADVAIVLEVGAEIVAGSSRLKAGTATKLVLNMLSTAAMVRLGHTRGDLMVDVRASNAKLRARAIGIVRAETGVSEEDAIARLERTAWDVRRAIE
ncbi:MAG: anhydro-N-acetylmuramic acid kinase [Chloroflexi bacterium]|nr:anhydro-N-acetylmuramic acid kinase [Chloroflexota bacterium]